MSKLEAAARQALEALEVATTPLAKDRREVLRARAAIREALAEQPAQPATEADMKVYKAIANNYHSSLQQPAAEPAGDDKMFEQIQLWARQSYARHQGSVRGQQFTAADNADSHIIWATLRWVKEQAEQQPVQQTPYCYTYTENGEEYFAPPTAYVPDDAKPLYTSQPSSKPWVGLTEDETRKINQEVWGYVSADHTRMWSYARAIEAKLREKNA